MNLLNKESERRIASDDADDDSNSSFHSHPPALLGQLSLENSMNCNCHKKWSNNPYCITVTNNPHTASQQQIIPPRWQLRLLNHHNHFFLPVSQQAQSEYRSPRADRSQRVPRRACQRWSNLKHHNLCVLSLSRYPLMDLLATTPYRLIWRIFLWQHALTRPCN